MKRRLGLIKGYLLALLLVAFALGNSAAGQDQIISIAIPSFQDDTGANAPADLGPKLAQDLHQKVAASYKDLLPRLVTGTDGATIKGLTIEQIAALGKQNGARFVARGGLLTVVSEAAGSDTKITVQLYADIISSDSAALVTTVRAEGSGTQTGAAPQLSAIDPKSDQFAASGMGQAFAGATAQLAESIHQAIAAQATASAQTAGANAQTGTQPGTQPDAGQAEAVKTAEADTELQQLIAQAESLVSSNANASNQSISAVSQALEALKSALSSKAGLMEKGQDTSQVDQEVATQKQALQTAVARVTTDASSSPGAATSDSVQQPGSQKKNFMDKISDFAGQALSALQKIQEMRNALQNFNAPTSGAPSADQTSVDNSGASDTGATDQQLGEANGSVTDQNGDPVPNAQVTDQNSAETTTTDSNGQYSLKGLLPNQLAKLVVKAGDKTMSAQAQIISGRSATVDFQARLNAGGVTQAGVLPSTVILNPSNGANSGIVKGVVRDALGHPVPRALVTLKGLGIARTNSQGEYAFLNVPAGPQQLIVNQNGLQTKTMQVQVLAGKSNQSTTQFTPSDRIAPPAIKPSLIISRSGATLRGSVSDADNRPVSGAKISAIQQQAAVAVFTGTNGTFEMRNLKPGPYHVIAAKGGYENSAQNISLSSSGSESVSIQMKPQSSPLLAGLLRTESARRSVIRGLVVSANGGAVRGASVALKALGTNAIIATSQTNQNGEYSFNVRAGQYEVRVSHASYQAASQVMEAKAGGTAQGNFTLKPIRPEVRPGSPGAQGGTGRGAPAIGRPQVARTGSVSGQVIDAKTRLPIAGAVVSVSGQKVLTDSAGNFALANLPAGAYQLSISKTGYSTLQRDVSVQPGDSIQLSLGLTPQAQLPIRIRKP